MSVRPGWFERQAESISQEVASWPAWKRRAAGLEGEPKMPMSPKAAKEHTTPDEQKALDAIVAEVDRVLPLQFQGGRIKIEFPKGAVLTPRMAPKLRDLYDKAGWKQVCIDYQKGFVELDESPPARCGSAWD